MRREKLKNKPTDDAEHNENGIDTPPSSSTEYDPQSHRLAAALEAATASAGSTDAQIDDEGQSHNIDTAVQYTDENDTPPLHHPHHAQHARMPSAERLLAAHQLNENILATTLSYGGGEGDGGAAADFSSTEVELASSSEADDASSEEPPRTLAPPRTTMEPPLREVKLNKQRVEVESERVELIEIKSDGSTGHLTPIGYR